MPSKQVADWVSDSSVVAAHLSGDERAFAELVKRYEGRLQWCIYRMTGDWQRAEDLVQEVFLRVHVHLETFDQSKKFSTWAYLIAINLAKNELRSRKRSPITLFSDLRHPFNQTIPAGWQPDFADPAPRPDKLLEDKELGQLLEQAMSRIDKKKQVVVRLSVLEEQTYEEISTRVGCPMGTVKSRLHRGTEKLRGNLRRSLR